MLTLTRKPMSTRDAVHRARLCYAPRQIARRRESTLSAFGIDTEDRRDIIAYAAASRQRSELESQNVTGLPETCRSQGAHMGRGCVRTEASDVDKECRQERSGLCPDRRDKGLHSEHLDQPLQVVCQYMQAELGSDFW